jgi:hypothetical protein
MKKFVFGLSVMFVFGFCLNVSAQPVTDPDSPINISHLGILQDTSNGLGRTLNDCISGAKDCFGQLVKFNTSRNAFTESVQRLDEHNGIPEIVTALGNLQGTKLELEKSCRSLLVTFEECTAVLRAWLG